MRKCVRLWENEPSGGSRRSLPDINTTSAWFRVKFFAPLWNPPESFVALCISLPILKGIELIYFYRRTSAHDWFNILYLRKPLLLYAFVSVLIFVRSARDQNIFRTLIAYFDQIILTRATGTSFVLFSYFDSIVIFLNPRCQLLAIWKTCW